MRVFMLFVLGANAAPCDVFDAEGTPCVAAHSMVRALYSDYTGPLYSVRRASDASTLDIGVLQGLADSASQDRFCAGSSCVVASIYDQSPQGNHLTPAPGGGAAPAADVGVNAVRHPVMVGGRRVYGAYFEGGMGYRNDQTQGVATDDGPQTMYMVTAGQIFNGACCFDYGNAETDNLDDGEGTMEAIYFGNSQGWGHGGGEGPWIMADLENGLWAGSDKASLDTPSMNATFVTAMVKGRAGGFALKGGDAQQGPLRTLYDGQRPGGSGGKYDPMQKQGAIILGIGGDNSNWAIGIFYEGVMTSGFSSDAADDAVQQDIVAAGFAAVETTHFEHLGSNLFCSNAARFQDGPGATATDSLCRDRCEQDDACQFYAFWSDHGCRTWDSCQQASNPFSASTSLWQKQDTTAVSV